MQQGQQNRDEGQIAQGRKLLKMADALEGKRKPPPASRDIKRALKIQQKTGVV